MAGRDRSPNYPALGLGAAIAAIRKLWTTEKRTAVGPEVAAKALGFTPKGVGYKALSGPARTALSALKKYGLVTDDGPGVRVSDLAIQILHPGSAEEHLHALREAAMKPDIFREFMQTHTEASDEALTSTLIRRGFSVAGARQFIDAFRDTLSIAKLSGSEYDFAKITQESEAMASGGLTHEVRIGDSASMSDTTKRQVTRAFSWPLDDDTTAEVRIVGTQVSRDHLDALIEYLEVAKKRISDRKRDE